jgi:hypothetical protein
MSRLTGTHALELKEAYNAVYAHQESEVELTEEQIREDFENWVNSLVEEGHDLSEYTWEDMYEYFVTEAPLTIGPGGFNIGGKPVQQGMSPIFNRPRPRPTAPQKGLSIGPGGFNIGGKPVQQGMSPIFQRPGQPTPTRPAPTQRPAATTPAAPTRPAPTQRPAATTPAAPTRPPAAPARPSTTPARPVAGSPKSTPSTQSPTLGFQLAQQGVNLAQPKKPSLASQAAELRAMQAASRQRQGLTQSFDVFDVIKGHLIDEGYADTEETALVIMANMSEDWREGILQNHNHQNQQSWQEKEKDMMIGKDLMGKR